MRLLAVGETQGYKPRSCRSVAQPGRALRSGRRGRRFKSCHSDQVIIRLFAFFPERFQGRTVQPPKPGVWPLVASSAPKKQVWIMVAMRFPAALRGHLMEPARIEDR